MTDNADERSLKEKTQKGMFRWGILLLAISAAFLLGLVPMWLEVREERAQHETTKRVLRMAELENLLTGAVIDARRGEYELARKAASDFFTNLDAEIEKADSGALTPEQRERLKPIFSTRDNTITMLAQRDQAAVERLADLYGIYRQAMNGPRPEAAEPSNVK